MNSILSRCTYCDGKLSPCVFDAVPGTQHHALLNSNEPPVESDAVVVRSTILQAEEHLAWLRHKIARLLSQVKDSKELEQLEEERVLISSYLAENRGIFSPLRRLPPELLCEIFGWTVASAKKAQLKRHLGFCEKDSPWVLTHVSHTWRAISVSTPSLWSTVTINYGTLVESSSYPLAMLETHVARAQKLRINFYGCDLSNRHDTNQLEIFQYLVKHASRWEELHLEATHSLYALLESLPDCVPLLRRVRMRVRRNGRSSIVGSFRFLNTAPSLVDINLYDQPSSFSFHPPSRLARYQLEAPLKTHLDILKLAPRLVEAHIRVQDNNDPWLDSREIIVLSSVRHLYASQPKALDYIQTPALEDLSIPLGISSCPTIDSFLARSSCALRSLCISDRPEFGAHETLAVINNIPSLIELRFIVSNSIHQVNALLAELTISDAGTRTVVPQLTSISFAPRPWVQEKFDYGAYVRMIRSRLKSPECALTSTTLCITRYPDINSPVIRSLDLLHETGLQFELLTGSEARGDGGPLDVFLSFRRAVAYRPLH
ncbi:hypothetical protein MSAN_00749700 [Mycena sanguinolenta]|uniref:F-box domain-containing protein n=1 Tax=Mycena sanguinolenta TaxID=230812 RepID=A0A8H7DGA1_9AGAR|nr:hypothetical protein MSAN_00749700 [Mycena sanguinolenta]